MVNRRFRGSRTLAVSTIAVAIAVAAVAAPAAAAPATGHIQLAGTTTAVPNSYIVVLKQPSSPRSRHDGLAGKFGGKVAQSFGASLNGFEVTMNEGAAKRLAADPNVAYVEQNQRVSLFGTQAGATWGLDRVDQRNQPLNGTYTYPRDAANVTAYIIDTGIRTTHSDFGGRATSGYDAVDGGTADDCNGHGTHVAGTVGGTRYGVAKAIRLVGVRVLDCAGEGTNADVIAGVNWVTQNARKPAVANMSLGGGVSTAIDNAVAASITSGVTYALAAGNDGANACNYSPARLASAITVGNTTNTDARNSRSNYGRCLDIFAPGTSITSAVHTSNTATGIKTGTSMASPHVAGAAALILSANPSATPAQVRDDLVAASTLNVVTSAGAGSPNRLLFVRQ
jgi:subtilisin family serine protease